MPLSQSPLLPSVLQTRAVRTAGWLSAIVFILLCCGIGTTAAANLAALPLAATPSHTAEANSAPATESTAIDADEHEAPRRPVALAWSIPFVLLLASIALMPFLAHRWWEKNYPRVSFSLAALVGLYYLATDAATWLHGMIDYLSFIILLGSLYTISGGITIRVNRKATPLANCVLLAMGAILANVVGTTGAAMLLIRPFLRMNSGHVKPYHVIFFIFIVANVGGALTPIGDPPLFLGYLNGVPFWWVAEHMFPLWAFTVGALLVVFYVFDTLDHGAQKRTEPQPGRTVNILGAHNFLFIAIVLFAVFRPGLAESIEHAHGPRPGAIINLLFSREMLMLAAALMSRRFTPKATYSANDFSFGPIREVAILFIGIFSTMVPALQYLESNADKLPLHRPGQFYFASGTLSGVLDNAPTYLTFLKTRLGEIDRDEVAMATTELHRMAAAKSLEVRPDFPPGHAREAIEAYVKYHDDELLTGDIRPDKVRVAFLLGSHAWNIFIMAISAGSVFWGACTYIGNGPNFMVKSIADATGVTSPSFMVYIVRYTLPILLPLLIVVWLIFFMGH